MSDPDHEFDYKLQRSRTRESSTLTIATVASSASLVLLGLYVQVLTAGDWTLTHEDLRKWVIGMGLLFAIFGIIYRDLTAFTIHRDDEHYLRNYDCNSTNNWKRLYSFSRAFILHLLLFLPIWGWLLIWGCFDLLAMIPFMYSAIISFLKE